MQSVSARFWALLSTGVACAGMLAGCDAPIAHFESNQLFAKRLELTDRVKMQQPVQDTRVVLEELFGTPDEPRWPVFLDSETTQPLVSLDRLQRAAGALRSDERGVHWGLYREHCIVCHGAAGSGLGPSAALLNPYPRDFRMGKFKFKSTPIGKKPTRDDLRKILRHGIVGTSMPSFALLDESDLEALVDYVIYLSVRGELERRLLVDALELDIDEGERLVDPAADRSDPDVAKSWLQIERRAQDLVASWQDASRLQLVPEGPPAGFPLAGESPQSDALMSSIARGKGLFQGTVAGCAFCHGQEAEGDGQQNNYDDWTRDWTASAGLSPTDEQELAPMRALGALKPRNILPRNLRLGVFRGGASPSDLYVRIVHGIEGTPMPAAPLKPDNPLGLSQADVWDLVNFLLSLQPSAATDQRPGKGESDHG